MIQITREAVEQYLKIVNDPNPIHDQIIPGQMVAQIIISQLQLDWSSFKIKYVESIEINEVIDYKHTTDNKVIVSNVCGKIKMKIFKS
ncbi:hypothetical protein [Staphylococcus caeli]|uniref:Uncharacterized protein n=1 Tax=Staphylococcus caeli TaxID=2201815 RepID=A0A1D4GBA5_9STAP|nr:hypothetical protein [Staphylococcus caeli]SCS22204.1 Uncharacterised protein [Staphylococcus caeli]SCS43842.1 Uncharacterised protein [Staphylococcus caeli]